jgi:hypothetical protein
MLNIRVREFVAQVWRPLLAAGLMYLCVWAYVRFIAGTRDSGAENLLHLSVAVGIGMTLYVLLSAGLWVLCGKPLGAERFALNKAVELAARLRWRKAAAS